MTQTIPATRAPRCRCGHGVGHPSVEAKPVYGFFKWAKLLNGIDTVPKRVEYRCRTCGTTLGSTTRPEVLREFR